MIIIMFNIYANIFRFLGNDYYRRLIMPYVIVRESYINNSCVVDGLPSNEVRLITEKVFTKNSFEACKNTLSPEEDKKTQSRIFVCSFLKQTKQIYIILFHKKHCILTLIGEDKIYLHDQVLSFFINKSKHAIKSNIVENVAYTSVGY